MEISREFPGHFPVDCGGSFPEMSGTVGTHSLFATKWSRFFKIISVKVVLNIEKTRGKVVLNIEKKGPKGSLLGPRRSKSAKQKRKVMDSERNRWVENTHFKYHFASRKNFLRL